MTFGLDSTGFTIKRLADIRAEMESEARRLLGSGVNLSSDGITGIMIGLVAGAVDEVWQQLQAGYDSHIPQGSEGVTLDNLAEIIGITREEATKSAAAMSLYGVVDTVVAAGTKFSVGSGGDVYLLDADVTLLGPGTPASGNATAQDAGPKEAAAGAIDFIVTPVVGLDSVVNSADAEEGRDAETDAELRVRLAVASQVTGSSTRGAIESRLIDQVDEVVDAIVVENNTFFEDADGRPPKSLEAIIYGPAATSADIGQFLFENVAGGIETVGDESETITDSRGKDHIFNFNWATLIDVEFDVTLTVNSLYPSDGDAQVRTKIDDFIGESRMGFDVVHVAVLCEIFDVPGIEDVTLLQGYEGGSLTENNITIDDNEKPNMANAATDITITSS